MFSLQFSFRQKYSILGLIYMTDKIRHFQKTFHKVHHHSLLKKLEYYGVRGISNKWIASYINNKKQFFFLKCLQFKSSSYQMWDASRFHTGTSFVSYLYQQFTCSN